MNLANDFTMEEQYSEDRKIPKSRKAKRKKVENLPDIIKEFLVYLNNNDYHAKEYKKRIVAFQRFVENEGGNMDIFHKQNTETALFVKIGKYENLLIKRISREEIRTSTVTGYLRTIQLFVKFLIKKNLINKTYTIPIHLRGRAKRANEYVPKDSIITLMNTIYENSNHVLRDLAIFLIIVDTGCRPIEVSNITMGDVDTIERTLVLQCSKTERRKIKISLEVMEVIKDYLGIRDEYCPKTEMLFTNCGGEPMTTSFINLIFYRSNLHAYGESRYPAKAFRHTYITNALQEYSFERVSKAIGHKDWRSTYYYYNRSNQRLLENTLDKSPLKKNGGNAHGNTIANRY